MHFVVGRGFTFNITLLITKNLENISPNSHYPPLLPCFRHTNHISNPFRISTIPYSLHVSNSIPMFSSLILRTHPLLYPFWIRWFSGRSLESSLFRCRAATFHISTLHCCGSSFISLGPGIIFIGRSPSLKSCHIVCHPLSITHIRLLLSEFRGSSAVVLNLLYFGVVLPHSKYPISISVGSGIILIGRPPLLESCHTVCQSPISAILPRNQPSFWGQLFVCGFLMAYNGLCMRRADHREAWTYALCWWPYHSPSILIILQYPPRI